MRYSHPEDVIALTPQWKGERFPDGRPKVADKHLDALYAMTLEELWKPIFVQGYENQFLAIKSLPPNLLVDFIKTDPRAAEFRDLDWSVEYHLARNSDPNDTQSAL